MKAASQKKSLASSKSPVSSRSVVTNTIISMLDAPSKLQFDYPEMVAAQRYNWPIGVAEGVKKKKQLPTIKVSQAPVYDPHQEKSTKDESDELKPSDETKRTNEDDGGSGGQAEDVDAIWTPLKMKVALAVALLAIVIGLAAFIISAVTVAKKKQN